MGVVGSETAFPVLYTGLVRPGLLPLEKLVDRMNAAPRARFGLPGGTDYSIWDLDASYPVDPAEFQSMGVGNALCRRDGFRPLQGDRGRRKAGMAGAINRNWCWLTVRSIWAGFNPACDRVCEFVFQTSMVGYQENRSRFLNRSDGGDDLPADRQLRDDG